MGEAQLTASSATATALTTTGRIGVNTTTPSVALDVTGTAQLTASSATAIALTTTGRIGVNTAAPTAALEVVGQMRVHNTLFADQITFGSRYIGDTNYVYNSISYNYDDNVFTIGSDRQYSKISFNVYGQNKMTILDDGKVGIGTTTPQYPVDIVGNVIGSGGTEFYWWGDSSTGNYINSANNINSVPIAIKTRASVWVDSTTTFAGFWATSDRRIKKNINYNISTECLNLFRQLKCSNYSYIDERENKTNVYGYIAQDVSTVIPYAVTTQKGFIPSIYSLAKISKENGIVKITCSEQKTYTFHSLHDNQGKAFVNDKNEPASDNEGGRHFKVKLFDASMNEYIIRINEILDNGVFTIENDETSIKLTHEEYFVFGQEVDDYKILNNEAIAIVGTAALQEVDRQQQADKVRIAELEATVASQQSIISDILERLNKNGL
jgi:hypothetical protein